MSRQELSGVDLARVALRAALATARKNGGHGRAAKVKPRTGSVVVHRDGREPMGLGAAIGMLVTDQAWELPAACVTLRERWEGIAPTSPGTSRRSATTLMSAASPCARSRRRERRSCGWSRAGSSRPPTRRRAVWSCAA
ncbi:hypothetical protein ACWIID_32745 [Streptomyces phaeochromogenes]